MNRKHFHPDRNGGRPLPREPTQALPGSFEKVRVLRDRARQRLQLWHPEDAKIPE
jgi:hypothetical protein